MRLSLDKLRLQASSRRTRERELILDRVQALTSHFSAENLVLSLARQGRRVSRATVYRTLELLVASGVLQRVHLGEPGAQYELINDRPPHAHLYCLGCGRLEDYPLALLATLPARVRKQAGFRAEHLLLRICGYCRRCRRAGKKSSWRNHSLQRRRELNHGKSGKRTGQKSRSGR